ncbi:hypothetical protein FQA39_LY00544 [Lamprigera yunnana]|nr:hypothetical protein FQA39_LY00544 [Lamprigera yunnana]
METNVMEASGKSFNFIVVPSLSNQREGMKLLGCDAYSEEEDVDSEGDAIIPDFREDTENRQEPRDTISSSFQLHTYSLETSNSTEEDPHISNEDEPQVSNEDKLLKRNYTGRIH